MSGSGHLAAMFPRAQSSEGFDRAEALRICLYRAEATLEALASLETGGLVDDVADAALGYVRMAQSLQAMEPADAVVVPPVP